MRRLFGIVPSVALIVAAACGGGGSQPTAGSPAASAAATSAAATPAATAAAAGPKLVDLIKQGKLAAYKVTYKWTMAGSGQNIDSTQTWYYKPPKMRYDFAVAGQGGVSISYFVLEDGAYICTALTGTAFCQKTAGQAELQQNPAASFDLQMSGKPDQFNATFTGSKTIAGQQAQCFGVKSVAAGAFGDVNSCYSSSGVPLFMQINSQGSNMTMEATSFSTTVSDADFKLLGPVR